MQIDQMVKQIQNAQKKMQDMQDEMAKKEFQGKSGGNLVLVTMTGSGQVRKVSVDPSLLKIEDKKVLEDLLVASYNDAKEKVKEESKNSMAGAFGNLSGFPGMNFPFEF